jgi:hypothetical protein
MLLAPVLAKIGMTQGIAHMEQALGTVPGMRGEKLLAGLRDKQKHHAGILPALAAYPLALKR